MGKVENVRFKGVRVELDRERHMRLTFSGIEYLIEKYGDLQKAFDAMQAIQGGITKDGIASIIDFSYACLMHEDRNLTRQDLADMLDIAMVAPLAEAIAKAVTASMPESKGGEQTPPA